MGGKDTRCRIVEAAMELFWLKGFASTSIADILSRSQVNSGSLYYYFPGKQDVLLAVLEAYRDGIHQLLLEPAWSGVEDPVEKVFALLAQYRRAIVETECQYGCPIGSLALAGTDRRALAELALNVMEGGVMQARTYRDVGHFDRAVAQFRIAVDAMLVREAAA